MRKMCLILAALVLVAASVNWLCMEAKAADNACGDNLTWTVENGILTISGTGPMWNDINDWKGSDIKTVILEEGVTTIGGVAFRDCVQLTKVELPDSLEKIGGGAFAGCTGLESIVLPDNVTSIETGAFRECKNLRQIQLPKNLESMGSNIFINCYLLETVELPASLKVMGNAVFHSSDLTSVVLPEGMTAIGDYVFYMCEKLEYIYIPASVTSIGDEAFNYGSFGYRTWHVLYGGTKEQWNELPKGTNNSGLPTKGIHFGCTGDEIKVEKSTAASCTEAGAVVYTCTICNETQTVNTSKLAHKWRDATCTEAKTCEVCGETEGEAPGHSYETVVKQPTCTEQGGTTSTCTICGDETITDTVAALGHAYGEWTQIKEPTAEKTGLSQRICEVCGDKEEQSIEKLPPAQDNGIVIAIVVVVVVLGAAAVFVVLKKKKSDKEN